MDFNKYKLSFNDAKNRIETYDAMTDTEFNDQIRHWAMFDVPTDNYGTEYKEIRDGVVETFKKVLDENGNHIGYYLDLMVGLKLYELLNPQLGDFTIIEANDDDVWRYISVCVFPDLTFIRYPNANEDKETIREYLPNLSYTYVRKDQEKESGSIRLKKKRFYSHTRRIWVKTLWWYIHLGWQGDKDSTYEVLKNNGSNMISQFIERTGKGYREQLYRCMVYAFSLLPEQKGKTFSAAAKLNLAKCVSVEPALTDGGELRYSQLLFDEVYDKEETIQNVEENDTE